MREIKFRAFLKEKKKILPVTYLTLSNEEDGQVGVADCNNEGCVICVDFYDYDQVELMQYTGLKDKNSKEIYEGDILSDRTFIKYEDGAFWTYNKKESQQSSLYSNLIHGGVEVIGNIYDNPELSRCENER